MRRQPKIPIYKVTMTETDTHTIVAYVEAPDERSADAWAADIEDAASYGRVTNIDNDWGAVEEIEEVNEIPSGYALNEVD